MPFFLRTGKSLADSAQLVTLVLRAPADREFAELRRGATDRDRGLFDLTDPGAVELRVLSKQPGTGFAVAPARGRQDGRAPVGGRRAALDLPGEPEAYAPGSWGPPAASEMTEWTLR